MTNKQVRCWIYTKLAGYIGVALGSRDKILSSNSYGSRKKLETISKDLKEIISDFDEKIERIEK